jgi:hypothetical protein
VPLQGDIPTSSDKNAQQPQPPPIQIARASLTNNAATATDATVEPFYPVTFTPPADPYPNTQAYDSQKPLAGIDDKDITFGADSPYSPTMQSIGGQGIPGPLNKEAVKNADDNYAALSQNATNAGNGRQLLDAIKHSVSVLNNPNDRGWNSSPALEAKAHLADNVNAFLNIVNPSGTVPRWAPTDVANFNALQKASDRLSLLYGGATGTGTEKIVEQATHATPRPGLAPYSMNLVISAVDQQYQHDIDKHDFQLKFAADKRNSIHTNVGSAEAFERAHPPVYYVNRSVYNATPQNVVDALWKNQNDPSLSAAQKEADRNAYDSQIGSGMAAFTLSQKAHNIDPQM